MTLKTVPLLQEATKLGPDLPAYNQPPKKTIDATVTGTGAVAAVIAIEACNTEGAWKTLATITLSGTGTASDGFVHDAAWAQIRANLKSISGTGAKVSAALAVEVSA